MKRLVTIRLFSLLFGILCATSVCAEEKQLNGHWEGAIIQPAGELKIMADFTMQGDTVKGTFNMPEAAVFNWPLSISYTAPNLKFRLPMGILFEGDLQGDTISGKVPSPTGGHVDTFYLKRKPAAALPYKEEDVTFQSGGVALTGTLRVPLTNGTHPAIFLLQGSGDVARDGEWFYADHFARHGIATLVYDKRGTGSSGGDYRDESFDDFAADALAGVRYLQSRKEINAKRVGLYGRSHGGMVIPLAASLSKDVAFIINVSGAGVSPHRQVTYQAETQMRRDGFSETEIAEAVTYMNQKWEVARTGGAGWDKLQATTQNASGKKWLARVQPATKLEDIVPSWKLQMGYNPMPALESVRCPVLAVFGELDTFTPVAETTANYRNGLGKAGNKDVTIKVFSNADHFLLVWPKPNDQFHWPLLAAGYLDVMTNWLNKHGAARK
ncbi:MAG TPA: alpha/beta fold hydrolase [Pyrinomonadaceae bacterium]|nr:alpha/beta fold hydrolase [Pyrinomonadaceae bacterium]